MEQKFKLWDNEDIEIYYYPALRQSTDATTIIFPGGGYVNHAPYEGEGYAQLLNTFGMSAFVINYRTFPNTFPLPLLDARRSVRFVRSHAAEFGISKDKILVMGSSAGGHLAALTSTYFDAIDGEGVDEIDNEDFIPNGQILCYAVISTEESIVDKGSYIHLLGEDRYDQKDKYAPDLLVSEKTPTAFIWQTANDQAVNVINAYRYAEALANHKIPHEMHIFPDGFHGQGLGEFHPHVAEWTQLLRHWLTINGFLK